jgi:hypothetical protein
MIIGSEWKRQNATSACGVQELTVRSATAGRRLEAFWYTIPEARVEDPYLHEKMYANIVAWIPCIEKSLIQKFKASQSLICS